MCQTWRLLQGVWITVGGVRKEREGEKKARKGRRKKKRGGKEEETEKGESKEAAITTRNEIRETTVESAPYWTTDERSSLDGTLEF